MKRIFFIAFLSSICASAALPAQSFSLITDREPVISLDGLWRFHPGDNPAWASPSFDDSAWPLIRSDEGWTTQGYRAYDGYAWYRFTIQVPDGRQPLGLLLPRIMSGYQVYADGKLMGSAGSTSPTRLPTFAVNPRIFPLPTRSAGSSTLHIAIRVWVYQPTASWTGGPASWSGGDTSTGSAAGDPESLMRRLDQEFGAYWRMSANVYAYCLLAAVVGFTIFGLFLLRHKEREYLWFSILLLAGAADSALLMAGYDSVPFLLFRLTDELLVAAGILAALAFFLAVLHIRRSLWWRIAFVAAALSPVSMALYYSQWVPAGLSYALQLCCLLPAYVWIITALSIALARDNVAARLLLGPAALLYGYNTLFGIVKVSWELAWQRRAPTPDFTILQSPYPLHLSDLINDIFVLALLLFLVRRFSLARQREERLASEFEAARSVQSLLIPAAPPPTPGFAVESVYLPAQEVGGDFYQVLPQADGSSLIVIGDVSGKGLSAALNVFAVMGALRSLIFASPANLLLQLNRVLLDTLHGGFVTCLCAHIAVSGETTLANAGHLAPYRNGEEIPLDAGLPLGISTDATYAESTLQLSPNDRLTFLSDGVVEARSATGVLFGFDRTQAISTQSAEAIAQAAQAHGQEDDITVLTLTFVPAEVLHA